MSEGVSRQSGWGFRASAVIRTVEWMGYGETMREICDWPDQSAGMTKLQQAYLTIKKQAPSNLHAKSASATRDIGQRWPSVTRPRKHDLRNSVGLLRRPRTNETDRRLFRYV